MMGSHLIKAWSSTQASVALSSGEAEYYGLVRGVGLGLGIQSLYRDIGLELGLRAWTDSSAAIGVAKRQGLGKLRHLECQSLWLQQRLRRGEFTLHKVAGETNPSDIFTKHLESQRKLDDLVRLFNCRLMDGMAASAPAMKLKSGVAQIVEDAGDIEGEEHVAVAHDPHVLPHRHLPEDIEQLFPRIEPVELERELDDGEHDLGDPAHRSVRRRNPRAVRTAEQDVLERSVNLITVGTATPPRHCDRGSRRQRGSPSGTPESLTVSVCKSLAAQSVGTEISSVHESDLTPRCMSEGERGVQRVVWDHGTRRDAGPQAIGEGARSRYVLYLRHQ